LTSFVASETLTLLPVYDPPPTVVVRIGKPAALAFASRAEIQLRRSIKDFPIPTKRARAQFGDMETSRPHTVAIAFGSNLGDSVRNIEHALRLLENPLQNLNDDQVTSSTFVHVVDTSFLYQSKAMYVKNQADFINGACIVSSTLVYCLGENPFCLLG